LNEPPFGSRTIVVHSNHLARSLGRLEVRIRPSHQDLGQTAAAFARVDRIECLGERFELAASLEREHAVQMHHTLESAPDPSPELDLSSDRALRGVSRDSSVQYELIGKLDRLGHTSR
jgi:hypothetical protein